MFKYSYQDQIEQFVSNVVKNIKNALSKYVICFAKLQK